MPSTSATQPASKSLWVIFLTFIPVMYLQAINLMSSASFNWSEILMRWGFILGVLFLSQGYCWVFGEKPKYFIGLAGLVGILLLTFSLRIEYSAIAWAAIINLYALLLLVDSILVVGQNWLKRLTIHAFIACWAGFLPVALIQIDSHFSDEEFYSLAVGVVLIVLWAIIAWVNRLLAPFFKRINSQPTKKYIFSLILTALLVSSLLGLLAVLRAYQTSFFPSEVSMFEGITSQTPFICGDVQPEAKIYQGKDIFNTLIKLVEAHPKKESPEYAFLALGAKDPQWLEQFKTSILDEAAAGLFTQPENSVKSSQYDASRRVYFYSQVIKVWPDLFTPDEQETLNRWFAAINRRAQTVGWVDWLYALALSKWPQGPYENQEIGAGLLALLETNDLADPALTDQNQQYLLDNPRGWSQRFRNTDDAYIYQGVWLANALFQAQYFADQPSENGDKSFEWLQHQALPDGAPLGYNHPYPLSPASSTYLGAELTGKDHLLWLAGRSAEYQTTHSGYTSAYPGLTGPVDMEGNAPDQGSCLLYGDSGLPNQIGPLAPDKIVFRSGWSPESLYLLLNLRFTGWHRYKATNTISLIYQDAPIIQDQTQGETSGWLPVGRSLFRDKRIPRENLNGFAIEKTGLYIVIYTLTSIGSNWSQDPPYYTEVEHFKTSPEVTSSRTLIQDWHGWDHQRTIHFYHAGLIVVFDSGTGPKHQGATVFWHLPENSSRADNRVTVRGGDHPVEMVLLPLDSDLSTSSLDFKQKNGAGLDAKYSSPPNGNLSLVTVFLTENWIGAEVSVQPSDSGPVLELRKNEHLLNFPLNLENESSD